MRTGRDERGEAVVQTIIVAPALFLLIMLVIQFALVAHAQNVAEAAAQDGASAASKFDASESDGAAKARAALESLGPRMLSDRSVAVSRSRVEARVTVRGSVLSLVPGFHPQVTESSVRPMERYVAPVEEAP